MQEFKKHKEPEVPNIIKPLKEDNPFVVPHNYFRELPNEIMDRINAEADKESRPDVVWLQKIADWMASLWAPRLAMVLATTVLLIGGFIWFSQDQSMDQILAVDSIDQDELVEYIQLHLDEFDERDFYSDDAAAMDHPLHDDMQGEDLTPFIEDFIDEVEIAELEDIL